jgi:hypothetical protein
VTNNIKLAGKFLARGTGLRIAVPEDRLPLEIRRKMGIAFRQIKGDDVNLFKGKIISYPFKGMESKPIEPKPAESKPAEPAKTPEKPAHTKGGKKEGGKK